VPQNKVTLDSARGEGMQIRSAFVRSNGRPALQITIENGTPGPLSGFALQLNKNSFGLVPESPASLGQCLPAQIAPGQSGSGTMPCLTNGPVSESNGAVQMAIKTNVKVSYFQDVADLSIMLVPEGKLEQQAFLAQWKGTVPEHRVQIGGLMPPAEAVESICPKLEAQHIFFIARRKLPDGADMVYLSAKTLSGVVLLAELGLRPGSGAGQIVVKSATPAGVPPCDALFAASIEKIIKS